MVFKFGDVRRSLKKKGFVEITNGHHVYLHHKLEGKLTGPQTRVSHGKDSHDIGPAIVSQMVKQLNLSNKKEVEDLVTCPMSAEVYVEKLQKAGVIPTPNKR